MLNLYTRRISKTLFFLGAFLFLSIIAITLINISMRFFDTSLRGAIELSGFLGAAAMGLCLPQVEIQKAHASAGIFFNKLPEKVQSIQIIITHILCFLITLAMTLELYDLTIFVHEGMETVDGWPIPSALFIGILSLGLAGQSIVIALELLGMLKKSYKKKASNIFNETEKEKV